MNWILILNGLIAGGVGGWAVGNYFSFGLAMTSLFASLGGAAGLGLAWRLQRYWD